MLAWKLCNDVCHYQIINSSKFKTECIILCITIPICRNGYVGGRWGQGGACPTSHPLLNLLSSKSGQAPVTWLYLGDSVCASVCTSQYFLRALHSLNISTWRPPLLSLWSQLRIPVLSNPLMIIIHSWWVLLLGNNYYFGVAKLIPNHRFAHVYRMNSFGALVREVICLLFEDTSRDVNWPLI